MPDLFGRVEGGAVAEGPRDLPQSWRTEKGEILAFDRIDDPTPYGWFPWFEEPAPDYDAATHRLEPRLTVNTQGKRIMRSYVAVPLSDAEIAAADPVPEAISDRQFAQVLALDGVISEEEALAWTARGDLPVKIEEALANIPEEGGRRFGARMLLSGATEFQRSHPLTGQLGALLLYDGPALDDIWRRGAAL